MNTTIVAGVLTGALTGFVATVLTSLLGDEVKGWAGRIPHAILWVASRRLPAQERQTIHADWVADLTAQLMDKSERPLWRVITGIRFAAGLVRGGRAIARDLKTVGRPNHFMTIEMEDGTGRIIRLVASRESNLFGREIGGVAYVGEFPSLPDSRVPGDPETDAKYAWLIAVDPDVNNLPEGIVRLHGARSRSVVRWRTDLRP